MTQKRTTVLFFTLLVSVAAAGCQAVRTGERAPEVAPVDDKGQNGSCAPCSFVGRDGLCMNRNFEVAQEALADPELGAAIERTAESCPENEVCILCTDPRTGEETGACDLAPIACPDAVETSSCAKPLAYVDKNNLATCAPNAHCIRTTFISDTDLLARLSPCDTDGRTVCMPDIMIETSGKFTMTRCEAALGNEGRCASMALPEVAELADSLPQDVCGDSERCVSCFDLSSGGPEDICQIGCDVGPTAAAIIHPFCRGNTGRCVEARNLDGDALQALSRFDCAANYVCVPNQSIDDGPYKVCTGDMTRLGEYTGTCLNVDLLDIDNEDRFDDDDRECRDAFGNGFTCVPCRGEDQELTGAPGCPANPPLNSGD